jgi:aquaporin Z
MYPYIAEYLGTFILIAVIAFVGNPYAIGAALTGGILLVGSVSGGHFNPAVTLWAYLAGKLPSSQIFPYMAAQLAAAGTVYLLHNQMSM